MTEAEHIKAWTQPKTTDQASSYDPSIGTQSKKLVLGQKWVPIISFIVLPLLCAVAFAVQGSPEVLQWIINFFNSLF